MELERIKTTSFHRLQRKELKARKLLGRFHDDKKDDRVQMVRSGYARTLPCYCVGLLVSERQVRDTVLREKARTALGREAMYHQMRRSTTKTINEDDNDDSDKREQHPWRSRGVKSLLNSTLLSPNVLKSCSSQVSAEQLIRAAEIRCAAVRAKDKAARTTEENEWVEIDKTLYPDIWRQKFRQEERRANLHPLPRSKLCFPQKCCRVCVYDRG